MPAKLTLRNIQEFLKANDINKECTLLSSKYINSTTPLDFRCNLCEQTFQRDYSHLKRGRFCCKECSKKKQMPKNKMTLIDIQKYIDENDINKECTLLSTEYIDNKTPLLFHCNVCNKDFMRDANHLRRGRFRCQECGEKAGAKTLKYSEDDVRKALEQDGIQLVGEYVNAATGVTCVCPQGHTFQLYFSDYISERGRGCLECARIKRSGINHWNYNGGGHQEVLDDLRHVIIPWKKDCLKNANYCCDICGEKTNDIVVHHLRNFREIVNEALKNTNLILYNYINEYSQEEREQLEQEVLKLHKLETGVVISRQYHDEFHQIYGKKNNTIEQYEAFKAQKQKLLFNRKE